MSNPGFSHIPKKIFICLDQETLEKCRLVARSWNFQIDQPYFWHRNCNFWLEKLKQHGGGSKVPHNSWVDLYSKIDKRSILIKDLSSCVRAFYEIKTSHFWKRQVVMEPIHVAAWLGFTSIVEFIASYKENPNEPMGNGWTPLHVAASMGHKEVVKFLACKIENSHPALPNGFLGPNVDPRSGRMYNMNYWGNLTPMDLAFRNGHIDVVIFFASKMNHVELVEFIIRQCKK